MKFIMISKNLLILFIDYSSLIFVVFRCIMLYIQIFAQEFFALPDAICNDALSHFAYFALCHVPSHLHVHFLCIHTLRKI